MKRILLPSFPRRRESRGFPPFVKGGLGGILLLLSLSTSSFAERIPIAVLDLDAKGEGLNKGVADVITETVRYEFGEFKDFDVVAREKMEQLTKEKAVQLSGCTDISCAVQIGKALNVKKMVVGSVGRLGQKYFVFFRVVDVEKENVVCNAKGEGEVRVEEIPSLVPAAVRRISACLTGQPMLATVAKPDTSVVKKDTARVLRDTVQLSVPGLYLQVAVFTAPLDHLIVPNIKERLEGKGYSVFISPKMVSGRKYFTVLVGPYKTDEEARVAVARLKREEHITPVWTRIKQLQ